MPETPLLKNEVCCLHFLGFPNGKVPGNMFYSNIYSDQLRQKIMKLIMPLKFDPLITASMHSKEIEVSSEYKDEILDIIIVKGSGSSDYFKSVHVHIVRKAYAKAKYKVVFFLGGGQIC